MVSFYRFFFFVCFFFTVLFLLFDELFSVLHAQIWMCALTGITVMTLTSLKSTELLPAVQDYGTYGLNV